MILSATSRSLLSQDMGGDGFSKEIADANLRNAGAHIQSALPGSSNLETLKRPPVRQRARFGASQSPDTFLGCDAGASIVRLAVARTVRA